MKHLQLLNLYFFVSLFAGLSRVTAQALPANFASQIDSVFKTWDTPGTPGAVVAVLKNGEMLFQKAYGMANTASGEKLTVNHTFWVASMAKQFTAMSIALLAEQGKISLDDDIRKYLPQLPYLGDTVRIRHLVHHTSGLRDGFTLIGLRFKGEKHYTNKNVVAAMAQQKNLNFKPGTRFEYLNSGYVLLAEIVAQASGKSFADFTEMEIFQPLGMTQTRFTGHFKTKVPLLATGYGVNYKKGRVYYKPAHFTGNTVGSSGLVTSLADLKKWDANFYHNKLGKRSSELIRQILIPGKLNNGQSQNYAFGLETGPYNGFLATSHSGADPGYQAEMVRFPDQHLTLICLANTTNLYGLTPKLLHMGASLIKGNNNLKTPQITISDPAANKSLAGYYLNPENNAEIRIITQTNGKLFAASSLNGYRTPLVPSGAINYQNPGIPEYELQFPDQENGEGSQLLIKSQREGTIFLQKLQPVPLSSNQLRKYTGKYYSPELNKTYRLTERKGKLGIQLFGIIHIPFQPLEGNRFLADLQGNNCLIFTMDEKEQVTGFTFNREAISNLVFIRKP